MAIDLFSFFFLFLFSFFKAAKKAAEDPSMVGDGVAPLRKSRYDSISTYLHYCKRRKENPMHVLEVGVPWVYLGVFHSGRGGGFEDVRSPLPWCSLARLLLSSRRGVS